MRGEFQHQEPGSISGQFGSAGAERREEVLFGPGQLWEEQPDALSVSPVRCRRQGTSRHAVSG